MKKLLFFLFITISLGTYSQSVVFPPGNASNQLCLVGILDKDPYYLNRANCVYFASDDRLEMTRPSIPVGTSIQQGQSYTFRWQKHPSIYARYKVLIIGNSSDTISCKDVGQSLEYTVRFCDVSLGNVTIIVTAYSTTYVDLEGRMFDTPPYFLCAVTANLTLLQVNLPVAVSQSKIESFCTPGNYTLTASDYPINDPSVQTVRWYNSRNAEIDDYFDEGKSINKYFDDTETVYYSYIREGECGDESAPIYASYTLVNNNIEISAPAPETKVVCSPGTHQVTVQNPPLPDYTIEWFDDINSNNVIATGNTITHNFPNVGLHTLYIAYRAKNECHQSGFSLSTKSPITVVVTDIGKYSLPPLSQLRFFTRGAGTYTLTNNPLIAGSITKWYSSITASTPLHTGNNFNTFLDLGLNLHYFSESNIKCENLETPKTSHLSFVVGFELGPILLEPNDINLLATPNPSTDEAKLYFEANGYKTFKINFPYELQVVNGVTGLDVTKNINIDNTDNEIILDTRKIPSGTYHVTIKHPSDKTIHFTSSLVKI